METENRNVAGGGIRKEMQLKHVAAGWRPAQNIQEFGVAQKHKVCAGLEKI